MQLLDSNIIIYSAKKEFAFLRDLIDSTNAVSVVSKIEVLGFYELIAIDRNYFDACFKTLFNIAIDDTIVSKAIEIRSKYKTSLGDSIIAATALSQNLELITRNTSDFKNIAGLKIINPFK